jgi:uncharacterized protein
MKALTPSDAARTRMLQHRDGPVFLAGWRDAVFLHFAVRPEHLQPQVPFELDLHHGMAYVSCVAFTLRDMRPRCGPAWLMKPIATHEFLNVRTYVKHRTETGIYFLAEWLPNLLSVCMGPALFGLPYRYGALHYEHEGTDTLHGAVSDVASGDSLIYAARRGNQTDAPALREFLLERYTAFTHWHGLKRLFRVWHPPWQAVPLQVELHDTSLLARTGAWAAQATLIGAHFARGFDEVWMGRPRWV